nr:Integrase, catalytic core [Ipomoea batatas]
MQQEKAPVSTYYTKLKSLWDEMMAISPLPKLKSQILSSKPTPNIGQAYHMTSEDVQQRKISSTHKPIVKATAFQTQKWSSEKDGKGRRRDKPMCGHCQKIGHTEDQCYEIIGYPAHWRKDINPLRNLTQAQLTKLFQFLNTDEDKFKHGGTSTNPTVNMAGKIDNKNWWVIDFGATDHIVCDGDLLNRVDVERGDFPVTIPNEDKVAVKSIGSTKLPNGVQINRVLSIPDFICNLVSVGRLTKDCNCTLTFFSDFCIMQDLPSRKLIGVGRMRDGLYYLEPTSHEGVAMSVKRKDDPDIWHNKLGHASATKIQKIQSDFVASSENGFFFL